MVGKYAGLLGLLFLLSLQCVYSQDLNSFVPVDTTGLDIIACSSDSNNDINVSMFLPLSLPLEFFLASSCFCIVFLSGLVWYRLLKSHTPTPSSSVPCSCISLCVCYFFAFFLFCSWSACTQL
jgi:hypothetical protein